MQPINLVLSGGGVRGVAHLGVVKALQQRGMVLEAISGVSSGAVAGAFLAGGYTPDEILQILIKRDLFQLLQPQNGHPVMTLEKLGNVLLDYFPDNRFERLNFPLIVSSSDLTQGHSDFFTAGELIRPLLASSSIPVLFEPVLIDGNQLVDGGVLNNLPVEPFLEEDVTLVGVHVNPWVKGRSVNTAFALMDRLMSLGAWQTVKARKKLCDLYLEPPDLCQFGVFDKVDMEDIFKVGYDFASKYMERVGSIPHSQFR
jgi:NTE family protein